LTTRIRQIIPDPDRRPGRPPALSPHRAVLLTLMLLRQNLPQTVAADLFGVSQPTVSRAFRRFAPLIGQVLCPHTPHLPDLLPHLTTVLVDGTLIPTGTRAHPHPEHPTDGRRRGPHPNHNGKHRRQGLSVQILTDRHGRLLAVTTPLPGRTHDSNAYRHTGLADLLTTTVVIGDLGYQGTDVITPRRKRPGHHHTPTDQAWNTLLAHHRWPVERAIAHLKNWKILATGYRGRLAELPTIIRIVTHLEHYRLSQ
jgi:hypothetical protein